MTANSSEDLASRISGALRSVPDFPQPGVLFRDITPLLANPPLFAAAIDWMVDAQTALGEVDAVACIESRGFLFGAPVAQRLACPLVPLRKPGKLPAATIRYDYQLEYGSDSLEMHTDAVAAGARVLLVDDVLATGGTAAASCELLRLADAKVAGAVFLMELLELRGRERLGGHTCLSLLQL